jgi:hypothetical protein
MTATTDPDARKAFVDGLRALARFLVSHPDMPVPAYGTTILMSGSDAEDPRGFVDAFAAMTGAKIDDQWEKNGHYDAPRSFGPVEYNAYAISARRMAAYNAETSYRDCVQPDDPATSGGPGAFGEAA